MWYCIGMNNNTQVVTGKKIGILRLRSLITAAKLEEAGMKRSRNLPSATSILKRELGIKGNREAVIAAAEAACRDVANW